MKFASVLCLACLSSVALAAAPEPAPTAWPIDPAQSQTQFSVRKFWFAHVRGTFPQLQGSLRRIDTRLGLDLAEVDASLTVASLEMDDADALTKALGPGFFDADRYPVVRFDSEPFPLAELVSGGSLHGMLDLHGEHLPVDFDLLPSTCPRQPLACPVRVRGAISRSAFGMRKWRAMLSDKVELDLRIVLRSSPDAPPPATVPSPSAPAH